MTNQRAVEEAKQALEKLGHTLVEIEIPNLENVLLNYFTLLFADKGYSYD